MTDDGREGRPFTMRLRDEDREKLMVMMREGWRGGFRRGHGAHRGALGPFIVWAALQWSPPVLEVAAAAPVSKPPRPRAVSKPARVAVSTSPRGKVLTRRRQAVSKGRR